MASSLPRVFGSEGMSLELLGEVVSRDVGSIPLSAPKSVWLVTAGSFDLFAVPVKTGGRWHHVGTIEEGAVVCAPLPGPRHTLTARPLGQAALCRIRIGALIAAHREQWSTRRDAGGLSPEERALARGVDLGLIPMLKFLSGGSPPREAMALLAGTEMQLGPSQSARPTSGLLWVDVVNGKARAGGTTSFHDRQAGDSVVLSERGWISTDTFARIRAYDTEGKLVRGELWEALLKAQARALYAVDRAVESRDRSIGEWVTLSRQAAQAAREEADQALQAVIQPSPDSPTTVATGREDPTFAACRLVADELGITVTDPGATGAPGRVGPIERIAISSRLRARSVKLNGEWWRTDIGPLVGHRGEDNAPIALRWRSGRYQMVDPVTKRRKRISPKVAREINGHAAMFYVPLPEMPVRPWRLLRFGRRGSSRDMRNLTAGVVVAILLGLLTPIATGQVFGRFVPHGESELIVQVCLGLLAASLTSAGFLMMKDIALLRLEGRFEANLQSAVWDRLLRLPTTFFTRYTTGELANVALGVRRIRTVLAGTTSVVLHASLLALANAGLLFFYSVPIALIGLGFLALSSAVLLSLVVRQITWQTKLTDVTNRLTNKVFQTLNGLPKLRVAAAESRAYADWARDFVRGKDYQKRIARYQNLITAFSAGYLPLCMLGLYLFVAGPAAGTLTVAQFLACSTAFATMLSAVMQATNAIAPVVTVVPMFRRLKPLLTEPLEAPGQSTMPGELSGRIEVNRLSFSYSDNAPPVLNDISFRVDPGEFVAIVGPSGCGKSTLLRLLLGFEKPTAGAVLYDGQDLSSLDTAAVRRQCGVVLQNTKVASGSIFRAIVGAQNFTIQEAWAAAEMAGLREDIEAMPMKMHTELGDVSTISGGQRQRLVIAQALIRRPRILFFDEATSALDNEAQRVVTDSTRQLQASRIVIAHRLSTVMDADKIIVLESGRIAECGRPADLLSNPDGLFHHLVRRQMTETAPVAPLHKRES